MLSRNHLPFGDPTAVGALAPRGSRALRERSFDRRAFIEETENAGLPNNTCKRVMWRVAVVGAAKKDLQTVWSYP